MKRSTNKAGKIKTPGVRTPGVFVFIGISLLVFPQTLFVV